MSSPIELLEQAKDIKRQVADRLFEGGLNKEWLSEMCKMEVEVTKIIAELNLICKKKALTATAMPVKLLQ